MSATTKLKTIAALKLRQIFTQATVTDETQIGDRVVDVVATFEEPLAPFGKGLIVEVQHKHDDKEIGPITGEYLREGYSVYWAYQSDFEDHDMTFAEHRARTVWPDAVPPVEGLDGYPECVQALLDPELAAVELSVPIPHEQVGDAPRSISPVRRNKLVTGLQFPPHSHAQR